MSLPLEDAKCCFVCGMENPEGLRIRWHTEGHERVSTKSTKSDFVDTL